MPLYSDHDSIKTTLDTEGVVVVEGVLCEDETERIGKLYNMMIKGAIETGFRKTEGPITHIVWPSDIVPVLHDTQVYRRLLGLVKSLYGKDMVLDYDMFIDKAPGTSEETQWHQDAAYWPSLPDQRALSCWVAIDRTTEENGCLWYALGSHKSGVRHHQQASHGRRTCDAPHPISCRRSYPVEAGSCILHTGTTLHQSLGNFTSNSHRRGLVMNFKPVSMVDLERAKGFDHGRSPQGKIHYLRY
eukprot:TRINITY_DN5165_c1_g1_i1.p1 TRINITY_DN5165_c1_g1~~TRINITY_DN5165_c1_g1_i1.p1  ORF type:complete len:253 (+),score=12.28 TRINITY_DN5165_c1_g1_i1:28-759(+)